MALRNVNVCINHASRPYRQAPWLNDRRPCTQSRSSSWLSPDPPAMKAETSALSSGGALPCEPVCSGRLRLPLVEMPRPRLRLASRRTGRGTCEVLRRRIFVDRVPGTQFSLSESPGSCSRSGLPDLVNRGLDSLDGFMFALFRPVSSLPRDETVRASFLLFSPMD